MVEARMELDIGVSNTSLSLNTYQELWEMEECSKLQKKRPVRA
jgi:hypothetical protein